MYVFIEFLWWLLCPFVCMFICCCCYFVCVSHVCVCVCGAFCVCVCVCVFLVQISFEMYFVDEGFYCGEMALHRFGFVLCSL